MVKTSPTKRSKRSGSGDHWSDFAMTQGTIVQPPQPHSRTRSAYSKPSDSSDNIPSRLYTSKKGRNRQFPVETRLHSILRKMSDIDQSKAFILQLPPEIHLNFISCVEKPKDLISLAHSNSTLRRYAVSRLYSRICLYRWSAKSVDVLNHLIEYIPPDPQLLITQLP